MAIAAINTEVQMILDQLGEYETTRTIIDQEREALALKSADAYSRFSLEQLDSPDTESGTDEGFNNEAWETLYQEYQVLESQIQAQDKRLEMERARIDTKIEMLETCKESAEKRLQQNIEKDFKGIQ